MSRPRIKQLDIAQHLTYNPITGDVDLNSNFNSNNISVDGKVNINQTTLSIVSQATDWDLENGANATLTLTDNTTLSIINSEAGDFGTLVITQDITGGWVLTLPPGSIIEGDTGTTVSPSTSSILRFYYDGARYWWKIGSSGQTGGQGIALPAPTVKILDDSKTIQWWNHSTNTIGGTAIVKSYPVVRCIDLPQTILDNFDVFVEMVVYKRKKAKWIIQGGVPVKTFSGGGYVIPIANYTGTPPNVLPWPQAIGIRTGAQFWTDVSGIYGTPMQTYPIAIDRPNHYKVLAPIQTIPVWQYLNGRLTQDFITYRDAATGILNATQTLVPASGRADAPEKPGKRFAYSSRYSPLYFAFRYIVWDDQNSQFFSGPLSKIIKLTHTRFPFNQDYVKSAQYGKAVASVSAQHNPYVVRCMFETNLP